MRALQIAIVGLVGALSLTACSNAVVVEKPATSVSTSVDKVTTPTQNLTKPYSLISDPKLPNALDEAVRIAETNGWRTGISIVDTSTLEECRAGKAAEYFYSQSTIKAVMAARLLVGGEMKDYEASAIPMITVSDDQAANSIFGVTGGDFLLDWANEYYGIHVGAPSKTPGWWGMNRVTPSGMARFLAKAYNDKTTGDWLSTQMSRTALKAKDGESQNFGLLKAIPGAWVKQGWGGDVNGSMVSTPSIGYIANGRYAVAIYTEHQSALSYSKGHEIVTAQASKIAEIL